jgi:hypothetical protein
MKPNAIMCQCCAVSFWVFFVCLFDFVFGCFVIFVQKDDLGGGSLIDLEEVFCKFLKTR